MSGFDWISARSTCTVSGAFKQLEEDVQTDLSDFAKMNPGSAQSCTFQRCTDDRFCVVRHQNHMVVFEIADSKIRVARWAYLGDETLLMVLTVNLDDDGKCVLIDEDQKAWKFWQVRRKALEETFFGSP